MWLDDINQCPVMDEFSHLGKQLSLHTYECWYAASMQLPQHVTDSHVGADDGQSAELLHQQLLVRLLRGGVSSNDRIQLYGTDRIEV